MMELIVYFSRANQNYVNGVLKELSVGNTEVVAGIIQRLTGAAMFQIEPSQPYSPDYNECIMQAQTDQRRNSRPELKAYPESISQYDIIYLGYPNYWSTMPMAVFTFLEHCNFEGKTIRPFCTHEGSGMGSSEQDIKRLCPDAKTEKGLALRGGSVQQAEPEIRAWLKQLNVGGHKDDKRRI